MIRLKNSVRRITFVATATAVPLLVAPALSPAIGDWFMKRVLPAEAKLIQPNEESDAGSAFVAGALSGARPSSSGASVVHGRISGVLDPASGGRGSSGVSPLDRQFGNLVAAVLEASRRRGEVAPFGAAHRKFVTLSGSATDSRLEQALLGSEFEETLVELDDELAEGGEIAFHRGTSTEADPDAERRRAMVASFLAAMDTTPPGGSSTGLDFCGVAISVNMAPIDNGSVGGSGSPEVVWTAPGRSPVSGPSTPGTSQAPAWYGLAPVALPASASYTSLIATGPLNPMAAPVWNNYAPAAIPVSKGSVSYGGSSRGVLAAAPSAPEPAVVSQSLAVVSQSLAPVAPPVSGSYPAWSGGSGGASMILTDPLPPVTAPVWNNDAPSPMTVSTVSVSDAGSSRTVSVAARSAPAPAVVGQSLLVMSQSLAAPAADPTLATFDGTAHGANPAGSLLLVGSTLYGTTSAGGANGDGTVFSLPVGGGTPTVLTSFDGASHGTSPVGSLILSGSTLYGTTSGGGAHGDGTVFSLPVGGGTPTVLFSFDGTSHGSGPLGSLILSGGKLYGTTSAGGANSLGTVFSLPVGGGTPTVLASFNSTDGATPLGSLILIGGKLYGTTFNGGFNSVGTVFSLPTTGGTPTVLYNFDGTTELNPAGSLTLSGDGTTLYGTAEGPEVFFGAGQHYFASTVFSLPLAGGTATDLADFNNVSGDELTGDVTLSGDGSTLYGTAFEGGANNDGVVFSLSLVPEPSTWMTTACGIALLGLMRRRPARRA